MSTENSKAFIHRYLNAINGKDKTPQVVDQFVADSDSELKQHIAAAEAAFPRYALEPNDVFAEGDKVLIRFTLRGVHTGPFMGIPATGKTLAVPGLIVYRITGGKIAEHWMQIDNGLMMQQLGVVQPA